MKIVPCCAYKFILNPDVYHKRKSIDCTKKKSSVGDIRKAVGKKKAECHCQLSFNDTVIRAEIRDKCKQ